ncbi:MAG TPA: tRNA lysidine(34) synthetase TilS, partial [Bacteroidales bacterium]|nr:tRNA lysidine(34) synthetase TilS [Bacteroidales bacterium]
NEIHIRIDHIQQCNYSELALHYLLSEFGFNGDAVSRIKNVLAGESGKIFLSKTHCLVKNRKHLIITPLSAMETLSESSTIPSVEAEVFSPVHLTFHTYSVQDGFIFSSDPKTAFLDLSSVLFPLTLRTWQHGDRFQPLGLEHQVKLSDFFVSQRLSVIQKKNVPLLCDASGAIIWVVGVRISHPHRITASTENILKVVLHDQDH